MTGVVQPLRELHSLAEVGGFQVVMQQTQEANEFPDRPRVLVTEDDSAVTYPGRMQSEQVRVMRHDRPLLACGEGELLLVRHTKQISICRGGDVDGAQSQPMRHGVIDVFIEMEADRHCRPAL